MKNKVKSLYFLFISLIKSNIIGVNTSNSDLRLPAKIEIKALFFFKYLININCDFQNYFLTKDDLQTHC